MAISLVGSMGTVGTASGASSFTPSFAQATTAGHLLIAWITGGNFTATISCSDPTWTKVAQAFNSTASVFYKKNCGSGETAPTFTSSPSSINWSARLGEFAGADTTAPLDRSAFSNDVSAVSPVVATTAGVDAAAGDLLITVGGWILTKAGTNTTADTYNNGATELSVANNDALSVTEHYHFSYGITTSAAVADSVSESNSSKNIGSRGLVLASFKRDTAIVKSGFGKEHG